jgi:Glycosyl hydrolases family 16
MIDTKIINFSGYEWVVRPKGRGGPRDNNWSDDNVWLDEAGLHLKITHNQEEEKWYCSEIFTTTSLGFGRYQFYVDAPVDRFHPYIVLGLFNYPSTAKEDGLNEIDIELTKWGNAAKDSSNGHYTVYPSDSARRGTNTGRSFTFSLDGTYTTHRFNWNSDEVAFQSLHGHRQDDNNQIAAFTLNLSRDRIPQKALPVHINLWICKDDERQIPDNLQEVEVIIKAFQYTPSST